jgi:hypothetical protein
MGAVDWVQLLADARGDPPPQVTAQTFLKRWETASKPVFLTCSDKRDYVVKGSQAGRMVVNDQVIARIGSAVGAPVGEPMLVDVPQTLIDIEPQMNHMAAGLAHGTLRSTRSTMVISFPAGRTGRVRRSRWQDLLCPTRQ